MKGPEASRAEPVLGWEMSESCEKMLPFSEHLLLTMFGAQGPARFSPSALTKGDLAMPDLQGREFGFREVD